MQYAGLVAAARALQDEGVVGAQAQGHQARVPVAAQERRGEVELGRGAPVGDVERKVGLEGSAAVVIAAGGGRLESARGVPGTRGVDAVEPERAAGVVRVAHEVVRIDIREAVPADVAEYDAVSQGEVHTPIGPLAV